MINSYNQIKGRMCFFYFSARYHELGHEKMRNSMVGNADTVLSVSLFSLSLSVFFSSFFITRGLYHLSPHHHPSIHPSITP